jgi:hypothetical protein
MTDVALSSTPPSRELTEDWLAVWVGLLIFVLALAGLAGRDLLGWSVSTSVWTDFSGALKATSSANPGSAGSVRSLRLMLLCWWCSLLALQR